VLFRSSRKLFSPLIFIQIGLIFPLLFYDLCESLQKFRFRFYAFSLRIIFGKKLLKTLFQKVSLLFLPVPGRKKRNHFQNIFFVFLQFFDLLFSYKAVRMDMEINIAGPVLIFHTLFQSCLVVPAYPFFNRLWIVKIQIFCLRLLARVQSHQKTFLCHRSFLEPVRERRSAVSDPALTPHSLLWPVHMAKRHIICLFRKSLHRKEITVPKAQTLLRSVLDTAKSKNMSHQDIYSIF